MVPWNQGMDMGLMLPIRWGVLSTVLLTVLEKLYTDDTAYRKIRESHYIEELNLKYRGMNRRIWLVLIATKNFYVHLGTPTTLLLWFLSDEFENSNEEFKNIHR